MKQCEVNVQEGDGLVTLYRKGSYSPCVAGVLGETVTETGKRRLWLDRLVHLSHEKAFTGWDVSGAISTVLTQQ